MLLYDQSTMGRPSTARERLLESARTLIHSSNYASASVEDLCAAAQVNKGSFYYFFPSKRDLALAVLDSQWERARLNVLEPTFACDVGPLERLDRFFERVAEHHDRPIVLGCPFGNLAVELGTLDEPIRDRVRDILEGYRAYFKATIDEAVQTGAIPPLDSEVTSQALVAYLQGALLLAKTHNDARIIGQLGKHARTILGVAAPTQSAAGDSTK
ncbi:MAG TPA: TetR/AcrR family transcriptional regulator [Chloroflexota bacterium]|nr:TetR/AcrR family transcriptional regulator [Chloroflexota bacterium]